MKKGHNIKEMLQKVNDDAQYKKDFVVNLKALTVKESVRTFPAVQVLEKDEALQLTDHSLNQLCGRLEIGTLYINKCLPVSQRLVAENLNFWIDHRSAISGCGDRCWDISHLLYFGEPYSGGGAGFRSLHRAPNS